METEKGGTFDVDIEKGFLVLEDEKGNKEKFVIEDDVMINEQRYLILCHEEEMDLGEYIALRVEEDEDGESFLATIENEKELGQIQGWLDEQFESEGDISE